MPATADRQSTAVLSDEDSIDMACDEFEEAWRAGREPRIEDYFDHVAEHHRRGLLRELVAVEVDYRLQRGDGLTAEEYASRFPEHWQSLRDLLAPADEPADDERIRLLAGAAPFSALPRHLLRFLGSLSTEQRFEPGQALIREGDPAASLFVVCEGCVEVCMDSANGPHVLARLGEAQVFGEMALLTDEPCTASVIAAAPVRALALPAAGFHRLARMYPEIGVVLTLLVASRLGMPDGDVLAGKVLNRYRILHRLGVGGMSVVYAAEDCSSRERVALKMLSHRLVYDRAAITQFQREADLVESFDHPNIVRTFGRFSAFHTYFIVMELCAGRTLKHVIQAGGPLGEHAVESILGQLAQALMHAHAAGIVHRDIKPANVMLMPDGTVKLMDFGLARPLAGGDPRLLGLLTGTPRYMAPEQLAGEPVTSQTDVFALGCVGFELLTARPLLSAGDLGELRGRYDDLLAAGATELRSMESDLRRTLLECLQPNPAARRVDLAQVAAWAAPVR